jgi:hypothetical protein
MKEQLIQIKNNILKALNANDNMLAKMALNDLDTLLHKTYSEDETIEEAILNKFPKSSNQVIDFANNLRREGAKYQSERMYSESEVIILLNKFGSKVYGDYTRNTTMEEFCDRWFEQNKK